MTTLSEQHDSLSPESLRQTLASVGNTPLLPVRVTLAGRRREVHLKLEGANPGRSIKIRPALALVEDLRRRGFVYPGARLVESTSGNLGVALAMVAHALHLDFTAVVDPKTPPEHLAEMRRLGASIEMVTAPDECGGFLLSRLQRVRELCANSPELVWTDQYSNRANPLAHYRGTGPEMYQQLDGAVDAVFVAVSTCGTLTGVGSFFRYVKPTTRIIAVDVRGSIALGGNPSPRRLTGIGSSRRPSFAIDGLYDDAVHVDDQRAFACCRALLDCAGVKVGGSSGAVVDACLTYLSDHPELTRVACICPDHGDNYNSSIFDDAWLEEHVGLPADKARRIEDVVVDIGVAVPTS